MLISYKNISTDYFYKYGKTLYKIELLRATAILNTLRSNVLRNQPCTTLYKGMLYESTFVQRSTKECYTNPRLYNVLQSKYLVEQILPRLYEITLYKAMLYEELVDGFVERCRCTVQKLSTFYTIKLYNVNIIRDTTVFSYYIPFYIKIAFAFCLIVTAHIYIILFL